MRAALVIALVALVISLVGTGLVWRQAERNRETSQDAQRGLTCLLQRAEQSVVEQPVESLKEAERKRKALAFYDREIGLNGGRRQDCQLTSRATEGG